MMDSDGLWADEEADVTDGGGAVDAAELLRAAPPIDAALNMNVSLDPEHGLIRLSFSQPTGMVSMHPEGARALAKALREYANDAERAAGKRAPRMAKRQATGKAGRW